METQLISKGERSRVESYEYRGAAKEENPMVVSGDVTLENGAFAGISNGRAYRETEEQNAGGYITAAVNFYVTRDGHIITTGNAEIGQVQEAAEWIEAFAEAVKAKFAAE